MTGSTHTHPALLRMTHAFHDYVELQHGDVRLFRYVYEPDTAQRESPKPYFHPLRTLAGNKVTAFRPHDHIWHKGLAMTMASLSGQNFWGGPSYVRDRGYVQLPNNGRMQHQSWEELHCDGQSALIRERLAWITQAGEPWIDEERRIEVDEVDASGGYWRLSVQLRLGNTHDQALAFGSPTVEGRPLAGYGGLFWRGPRSFRGGAILAGGGPAGETLTGPEVMGKAAPWLAFTGKHDGNLATSTLLFIDQPGNLRYPNKWFVRTEPYATVSFAFSFDEVYVLEPGQELDLRYKVVIADGAWDQERIEAYVGASRL